MEKSDPLVSVCMPAYNAGKYIAHAVASVLGQSYEHIELIIVNDGSTDDTASILAQLTDPRVTILTQTNKGQSAAANTAYKACKGELIKFVDADDIISPAYIEKQVARLGGRIDVVTSAAWGRFYNNDLSTFKLNHEDVWKDLPADEWLVRSWRRGSSMMQCALWLIPRPVIEKAGLWDESLSLINDFDFFTRVLLNCSEVLFEREAVLYYRSGIAGSLSDSKSDIAAQSAFRSIDQGTQNLFKKRTDTDAKLACANTWQDLAYNLYPKNKALAAIAEEKVKYFGGSDISYASAGITGLLLTFLNWKTVKYLKSKFRV
ncbi:glycosyltransferase family 2 protein [Inquilinus sp. KBS0705]|nr:glycosyltransferase family 2 protein [Inquilinus sp. KBS0705]